MVAIRSPPGDGVGDVLLPAYVETARDSGQPRGAVLVHEEFDSVQPQHIVDAFGR